MPQSEIAGTSSLGRWRTQRRRHRHCRQSDRQKIRHQHGHGVFEAKRRCPTGVLCPPHYDEYRCLSLAMFKILEEYAPVIVPMSIDEGFLDLSTMSQHVWRDTTPLNYMKGIGERIRKEVGLPVSGGLANSAKLAKLSTDVAKPGFMEVPQSQEKEFLKDRPVRELSGIGKNRQRCWPPSVRSPSITLQNCRPCCSAKSSASGDRNSGCLRTVNGTSL